MEESEIEDGAYYETAPPMPNAAFAAPLPTPMDPPMDSGEISEPAPISAMTATAISQRMRQEQLDQERAVLEKKKAADAERNAQRVEMMQQRMQAKEQQKATAAVSKDIQKKEEEKKKLEEKRRISAKLRKLALYRDRFPNIAHLIPTLRKNATEEEVDEILELVHEEMMSQGSVKSIANMVNGFFRAVEVFWGDGTHYAIVPEHMRLNLTGVSDLFRRNKFPELDPLIMELDIEYPGLGRRSLWSRILSTLVMVFLTVNAAHHDANLAAELDLKSAPPVDLGEFAI